MIKNELIEAIERLGDYLKLTSNLANNIFDSIKKEYDVKSWNVQLLITVSKLKKCDNAYTLFHSNFFKKIMREMIPKADEIIYDNPDSEKRLSE